MTSPSQTIQPPRLAVSLLTLFALNEEAESILGDLLEEFSLLATRSGIPFARRWYWRQTLKTVVQLGVHGFRTAPLLTTAAIVGGFLLRKVVGRLIEPTIFSLLVRYQVPEHHFSTYVFFASTGIDLGYVLVCLLVGFIVALVAKGREMVATLTLGLIFGAMALLGVVVTLARMGYDPSMWRLTWYFSDSLAIVISGAIVRSHRVAVESRPLK
jgi:hypothetical protein